MLKTNEERLVMQAATGIIRHSRVRNPYVLDSHGNSVVLPSVGTITYNVQIGDSVYGFEGDHLEPSVTIQNKEEIYNNSLNVYSCIGNEAKVISGDAKGAVGYVTGTHGGVEHTIIHFSKEDMENMAPGDNILVKTYGQGLKLLDHPDITVMNIDPALLQSMGIEEKDGKLVVPVAGIVPAYLMGSGLGSQSAHSGDYDIMDCDENAIKENHLENLKFGDFVFLQDCDTSQGRGYLKGAVTIGVVIHGACVMNGHGPGVTTVLASKTSNIVPKLDENANIKNYIFPKMK